MRTIPADKANHMVMGSLCALAGVLASPLLHVGQREAALAATALAAVLRELYGLWRHGRWDWADILATMLGGLPVMVVTD